MICGVQLQDFTFHKDARVNLSIIKEGRESRLDTDHVSHRRPTWVKSINSSGLQGLVQKFELMKRA